MNPSRHAFVDTLGKCLRGPCATEKAYHTHSPQHDSSLSNCFYDDIIALMLVKEQEEARQGSETHRDRPELCWMLNGSHHVRHRQNLDQR